MEELKKITIMGAGAFGFALAKVLGDEIEKEIYLYDVNCEVIEELKKTKKHLYFHKNIKLNKKVKITSNEDEAIKNTDLIILAVPSKFFRIAIESISEKIKNNVIFLSLAKGFEDITNLRMSEVVSEVMLNSDKKYHYACLSGGMIAAEVAIKRPIAMDIACKNLKISKKIKEILNIPYFKINITDDVIGVELAGILKNVIAIGSGFFDGLEFDESSKAAFVSVAAKRAKNLAVKLGAKPKTFDLGSQAFLGDLMTTCFGNTRNREFGELIGRGNSPIKALEIMKKNKRTVEGFHTIDAVTKKIEQTQVECKLISGIYKVLHEEKTVKEFLTKFIDDL